MSQVTLTPEQAKAYLRDRIHNHHVPQLRKKLQEIKENQLVGA